MNPAPEDPLARMARWDALRRRVDGRQVDSQHPAGQPVAGQPVAGQPVAGQHAAGERTAPPIDELAAATRRVVEQDPSASVMITVRSAGGTSSVRVAQVNGQVAVTVTGAEPPAGPRELPPGHAEQTGQTGRTEQTEQTEQTGQTGPLWAERRAAPAEPPATDRSSQIIAELAELLRQDPSFLSRPR